MTIERENERVLILERTLREILRAVNNYQGPGLEDTIRRLISDVLPEVKKK